LIGASAQETIRDIAFVAGCSVRAQREGGYTLLANVWLRAGSTIGDITRDALPLAIGIVASHTGSTNISGSTGVAETHIALSADCASTCCIVSRVTGGADSLNRAEIAVCDIAEEALTGGLEDCVEFCALVA
jgi:hypothetical protein